MFSRVFMFSLTRRRTPLYHEDLLRKDGTDLIWFRKEERPFKYLMKLGNILKKITLNAHNFSTRCPISLSGVLFGICRTIKIFATYLVFVESWNKWDEKKWLLSRVEALLKHCVCQCFSWRLCWNTEHSTIHTLLKHWPGVSLLKSDWMEEEVILHYWK